MQFEEWEALLHSYTSSKVHVEKEGLESFAGCAQPLSVYGLQALHVRCTHVSRVERDRRHVRRDGRDNYQVALPLAGVTAVSQNDWVGTLGPGNLALSDSARPVDFFQSGSLRLFLFRLPRRMVISNLGFDPPGGLTSSGTLAGRLILQLVSEVLKGENPSLGHNDTYMQLAICDLLCALFARPDNDPNLFSRHTEQLFAKVCGIIRDGFTDPDLTPSQVAAEAGISLRYLQKLFTPRGTTCSHFIHSQRLDHAARLLHRRDLHREKLPLSEIALASGFRDYTFFSRKFRQRFGCVPGAYTQNG
jgi:AraC-like DNA-binding protein